MIFLGILVLSGFALAALAVVAPIVLAISVLAGLFAKSDNDNNWRSAGA